VSAYGVNPVQKKGSIRCGSSQALPFRIDTPFEGLRVPSEKSIPTGGPFPKKKPPLPASWSKEERRFRNLDP